MRFKGLIILLVLLSTLTKAQTSNGIFIKELIESMAEDLPDDYDLSELEEKLVFLSKHPINLNRTSVAELKSLIFLSPIQMNNLLAHIKENGALIDVLELQSIPNFDLETVQNLLPFVTVNQTDLVDQITLKNLSIFGEHDLVIRLGRTIEKQKGFYELPGSHYLGTPERLLLRYKYNFSNRISAALITEKDAGEPVEIGKRQSLLDYQSAHLAIYNTWKFKQIIIGDYTLQFGQGLTLWSGFAFGKAPDVASVAKKDAGLKAYSSANEYSFFRGAATTFNLLKNIELTTFFSTKKLDASLDLNSENEPVLSNINETGLHRTATEIKNRNSLWQKVYGMAIQYQKNNLSFGAIAYHHQFSKAFITGSQPYRTFNFTGKRLTNIGANYSYTFKNSYLFGEIGKSSTGGIAFLNGILLSVSQKISAAFVYRKYQRNYHNFYNQAMAEGGDSMNESGLYAGINISPQKALTFSFYADYFKFPWLKFRIDAPSSGYEILAQLAYTPTKIVKIIFRYKSELKQQNTTLEVPINFLDNVKKESYRADANWQFYKTLKLQNRIEFSQFMKGEAHPQFGYLIYQDISYAPLRAKLSGNLRIAYFNTPTYDSRIYAYEDDVLYNFTFGMYNGKGLRAYLNLKYELLEKLTIWARYAIFFYPDNEIIGSGLDEISGNKKTDIKLQLRYQF